jgi:hypothetical protein
VFQVLGSKARTFAWHAALLVNVPWGELLHCTLVK